ncbi:hypothetical protein Ancab_017450, partial [Ancistrocladus abbreviatus]
VNNNRKLLAELKIIWVGSFKLRVDSAQDRDRQGRRGNSMIGIEEGKSVARVLDENTWPRRNMARRKRKTFADVVRQEYSIR